MSKSRIAAAKGDRPALRDTLAACDRRRLAEHAEERRRQGREETRRIRVTELLDAEGRSAEGLPERDREGVAGLDFSGLRVAAQVIREVTDSKTG